MTTKTLLMPEDVVVHMLKTLPKKDLINIFCHPNQGTVIPAWPESFFIKQ